MCVRKSVCNADLSGANFGEGIRRFAKISRILPRKEMIYPAVLKTRNFLRVKPVGDGVFDVPRIKT